MIFPEDRIEFGDLPAGSTSEYHEAPDGVYRYAAYEFVMDGRAYLQPVIDWVGEQPVEGQDFTYTITADSFRSEGLIIQLERADIDKGG